MPAAFCAPGVAAPTSMAAPDMLRTEPVTLPPAFISLLPVPVPVTAPVAVNWILRMAAMALKVIAPVVVAPLAIRKMSLLAPVVAMSVRLRLVPVTLKSPTERRVEPVFI